MDMDGFLAWSEGQDAHFELHEGAVVAIAPERYLHLEAKLAVVNALQSAIRATGAPCRALPDGATIRASNTSAFVPDALFDYGPRPEPGALEIPNPITVFDVLSPSKMRVDFGVKLETYFALPSVVHFLIVDPDRRRVIHHEQGVSDALETRNLDEGMLKPDLPGLKVPVESLFGLD